MEQSITGSGDADLDLDLDLDRELDMELQNYAGKAQQNESRHSES